MNANPFSLSEKLILITGASSGIGRQCAISCSGMGASVLLFGRDRERLEETFKLMDEGQKHSLHALDLLDYDLLGTTVSDIVRERGRIDGLINCAGISTTLPLNAVSPKKMDHFFQTNVIGGVNLARQVVKSANFSESGGSIVFISSVMGVVGENGKTLYSMTKGALIAAVKSMSVELAKRKIRVNAVSPGVVVSPMSENAIYSRDEASRKKIEALHPLGTGKPEDVANACIYLLSDAAEWVSGTNLVVDGAYLAK
jgi:NAD(P)-dependent dehydrogenase (short-subunit alcohol dehydrogenase family)